MIDLHNLHLDNCVDLAANPLNERREEFIKKSVNKPDDTNVESFVKETEEDVEKLDDQLENVMLDMKTKMNILEETFVDCFSVNSNG